MDLNLGGTWVLDAKGRLAPSWSHGSKYRIQGTLFGFQSWLPRGAMDLNKDAATEAGCEHGWLPRGAMDLNSAADSAVYSSLALAPSWSHGSKFRACQSCDALT